MSTNQLPRARALQIPDRQAMLRRDSSVQHFWNHNRDVLRDAWVQWDAEWDPESEAGWETESESAPANPVSFLGQDLFDTNLHAAMQGAWQDPSTESSVRDLLYEITPDVFSFQLFDPKRLGKLRAYLEQVWDAEIPLRPPYGIVLNRRGAMLDQRSPGYLAAPRFQGLYQELFDTYMRPIARLLFPEVVGHDTQTFGFSINYRPETDTSIRPHSDASAVTLNINLNTPGEQFDGSRVDFLDRRSNQVNSVSFEPGVAIMHRGSVPHTAQPITSGERTNFVLWLYGNNGALPTTPVSRVQAPDERWTIPTTPYDSFAPF